MGGQRYAFIHPTWLPAKPSRSG